MSSSLGSRQRRRRTIVSSVVVASGVACLSYAYYRWLLRRRVLTARSAYLQRASELSALFPAFYALFEQCCGGCMSTASVHSALNVDGDIVLFCSGGWAAIPPSVYPLPMYGPPPFCSSLDSSSPGSLLSPLSSPLSLYWYARCLGKARVFNSAFAFFLALILRRASFTSSSSSLPLTLFNRPIRSLSLSLGCFVSPASLPPTSVVCEIGTLSPALLNRFRELSGGVEPDLRGPDLALVAEFGTQRAAAYTRAHGRVPAQESADVDDVVWQRERFPRPTSDVWVTVDTEDGRFHIDLSEPQYGLPVPFAHPPAAIAAAPPSSTLMAALRRHRPDLLEYAPPHPSAMSAHPPSPHPVPHVLSESEWKARGGMVKRRVEGAERVIRWVQDELLLDDRPLSVEYVQLEAVLREACRARALSTTALYNHSTRPAR